MKRIPLQLEPEMIADHPNCFRRLCEVTGELAEALIDAENPYDCLGEISRTTAQLSAYPENCLIWQCAVARECLLAASLRQDLKEPFHAKLPETLLKVSPFGEGGPALSQWLMTDYDCAVAIFPLADENSGGTPGLAQAWAFRPESAMPEFIGADVIKREESAALLFSMGYQDPAAFLCVEEQDRGFTGPSWQLATALAGRCLQDNDSERTFRVASRWIVTGGVEVDRVSGIGIGNKTGLKDIRRNWIFPMANHPHIIAFLPTGEVKLANTVDDAWDHVCERGVEEGGTLDWPEGVGVFHTLVSERRCPVLQMVAMLRPAKVVLWHSQSKRSSRPAEELKNHLLPQLFGFDDSQIELAPMESKHLKKAESQVREETSAYLHDNPSLWFNVTNGNLLMRFAVQSVARLEPRISLIYKDVDAAADNYTVIRYTGSRPTTLFMKADPARSSLNWEELTNFEKTDEPWRDLLKRVRNPSGKSAATPTSPT